MRNFSDEELKTILFAMMALGGGIFSFARGFRNLQLKRLIENTPTSKIRSLAMGLCEICGIVENPRERLLEAPFTQRPCVYYTYTVEEYRRGKNSHEWHTIGSGRDDSQFYLRDETGAVLVDSLGCDAELSANHYRKEFSGVAELPAQAHTFLTNFGVISGGFWGRMTTNKLRLTEYCICPGDQLYVLGTACDNPYVAEGTAEHGHADIMLCRGPKRMVYYISDQAEHGILRRFGWRVPLQIFGGAAAIFGSLAFLLWELGAFGA